MAVLSFRLDFRVTDHPNQLVRVFVPEQRDSLYLFFPQRIGLFSHFILGFLDKKCRGLVYIGITAG